MDLVYLDINCFQRGFDDPSQARIQIEAMACQIIFQTAEDNEIDLIWSFMHEDEITVCPFPERKIEVYKLSTICKKLVKPSKAILDLAQSLQNQIKLSSKDALHLACAMNIKAGFFLTCDDIIIKRSKKLDTKIKILNPLDYVKRIKQ